MNIVGIIPARMASTRFPDKPLKEILGKPMIFHVYWRSKLARSLNDVYVATPDKEIQDYCIKNDMKVIMTKDSHTRASDRAAEAMFKIEELIKKRIDIPVMIQGDEPMVYPEMIEEVIQPMICDENIDVVNIMAELKSQEEHNNSNIVKVVCDLNNFALYFSREPIPSIKKTPEKIIAYKQIAIIPFRRNALIKFNELKETPLEIIESVDMLRFLENGYKVRMISTRCDIYGVDTPQDLEKVEKLMEKDRYIKSYINY